MNWVRELKFFYDEKLLPDWSMILFKGLQFLEHALNFRLWMQAEVLLSVNHIVGGFWKSINHTISKDTIYFSLWLSTAMRCGKNCEVSLSESLNVGSEKENHGVMDWQKNTVPSKKRPKQIPQNKATWFTCCFAHFLISKVPERFVLLCLTVPWAEIPSNLPSKSPSESQRSVSREQQGDLHY